MSLLYRITVKRSIRFQGEQIDKGAFVDFQAWKAGNPVCCEKQRVAEAFHCKYQVDMFKLGALNLNTLDAVKLNC